MREQLDLRGDRNLRAAYAAHAGELYGFAMRALGDVTLAEDAVQETFLRAWRAGSRYDPALSSLRTWLFTIMRNVIVDLARARASRPALSAEAPRETDPSAADELDQALLAWQVEEALRRISADHRTVLVETQLRGRSYAEVAAALGIPEGTVKSRVYYALKALRLALEEMGWTDEL